MERDGAGRKARLLAAIGDMRQVAGFQRLELTEGKGKGNEVIHVRNGSGLTFQIAVSRAFDIGLCELHGLPLSWMSHCGPVTPHRYEPEGTEWNRSFEGGLLATCGLQTIGRPSVDRGIAYGQHGRISSEPAEVLQTEALWRGNEYELVFRGKMAESKATEEHVTLVRTIRTRLGDNTIELHDVVTNETYRPVEHAIMYHFNFGWPLVSETTRIHIPSTARRCLLGDDGDRWPRFGAPTESAEPVVVLHERLKAEEGTVSVVIENEVECFGGKRTLRAAIDYPDGMLPCLTQWKHERAGIRALGIEPGNVSTEGRAVHRSRGSMPQLAPWESREYRFRLRLELGEGR
ncbi:MAG: aldose 1-epimerase family protein [Paenibacillaceae bacterium]|nr:aldose 1-epimerase family protein [Paenibacillaceae bacterium]